MGQRKSDHRRGNLRTHEKRFPKTTGTHDSDNAALFVQYDQRFFDRLSVSAGMRAEYYRVDGYLRKRIPNCSEPRFRSNRSSAPD